MYMVFVIHNTNTNLMTQDDLERRRAKRFVRDCGCRGDCNCDCEPEFRDPDQMGFAADTFLSETPPVS